MKKTNKENLSFQIILTAKDGRFGTTVIEGGLNKQSAQFEAKYHKKMGHIVKIFDKQNKKFISF
mgnify:CR=1 FL=1